MNRETSNGVFWRVNSCFNGRKRKIFYILSWLAIKSGYTTISWSVENHGVHLVKIIGNADYLWFQASILHMMEWARYSLLWVAQSKRNYYGRSLSTKLDAFELSIVGKTAPIPQYYTTCKKLLENAYPIRHIHQILSLSFVYQLFQSISHGMAEHYFHSLKDANKMAQLLNSLKTFRREIQMLDNTLNDVFITMLLK